MPDAKFTQGLNGFNRVVAPGTPEHDALTRQAFPNHYKQILRAQGRPVEQVNGNQRLTDAYNKAKQLCMVNPTIMAYRELLASLDADTRRFVVEFLLEELNRDA